MRVKNRLIQIAVCVLCVGVGLLMRFGSDNRDGRESAGPGFTSRRFVPAEGDADVRKVSRSVRKVSDQSLRERQTKKSKEALQEELQRMLTEEAEGEKLSAFEKELLGKIQELLGDLSTDPKRVRQELAKLLARIAARHGEVSAAVKIAAMHAAATIGEGAAIDILPFLADADVEVQMSAMDLFMESVSDFTLGDRDRAQLVIAAAMTMTSSEQLDWVFSEFSNMRHSVAAEAFVQIIERGTDQAKDKIAESVRFYTGEDGIETVEALEQWLEQNPDGPDDEDFYGPPKPGSGINI